MDGQVRDHPSAAAAGDGAPSTSGTAHYDDDNAGGGGGPKVWVLVLLFALLLLPFLPSAMRRGGGTPWAGRGGGGGGAPAAKDDHHRLGSSAPATDAEHVTAATTTSSGDWGQQEGYDDSMSAIYASLSRNNHAHAHASGIRRMKSSSSYPELRQGSDGVWALASPEAAWRFYDDAELYRARRPERQERSWDVDPHRRTTSTTTTTEVKTIPVDTFVERGRTEQPREPPPPLVSEGEDDSPSVTASPAPAYCASPDVNTKADRFIESFREGLKLEKLNSYREKWQRQIQENAAAVEIEEEGEFMVIGSLFGDDDEDYDDGISLPQTPATAAVAVGF